MKNSLNMRLKDVSAGNAFVSIWKRKFFLIIVAALVVVVMMLNSALSFAQSASGSISLNYEQASQGLNPNGTRFNIYEMESDEVLNELLRVTGLEKKYTCADLRDMITIEPANTGSVDSHYIATGYYITLSFNGDMPKDISAENMLEALLSIYQSYFFDHYGIKTDALNISWEGSEDLDYLEFYELADAKVSGLTSYLQEMIDQSGTTQYQIDGETFRSLKESVANFESVQLKKFIAFIRQTKLFLNPESYKDKMVYQRLLVNMKYEQSLADYQINVKAVEDYDESMITFVMVPMYDTSNWLYMARTEIGTDTLTQAADDYSREYKDYAQELAEIDRDLQNASSANTSEEDRAKATELIANIKSEMNDLAERIRTVSDAYINYRSNNDVQWSLGSYSLSYIYGLKKAVLAGGAVFVLLCAAFIIKDSIRRKSD